MRVLGLGQPVLQHEGGDALVVHPLGDVPTFLRDHELRMSAARRDHDRHPVGLLLRRQKGVDGRVVNHRELFRQFGIVGSREDLGSRLLLGARRTVRPKPDLIAALSAGDHGGKNEGSTNQSG